MRTLLAIFICTGLAACGSSIGDSCNANVDCSSQGDRSCDVASPGGYCTIEGCDNESCPGEAVCIRFFEQIPTEPCNPATASTDCLPSERCLCDCGDPLIPGACLTPNLSGSADDGTLVVTCPANSSEQGPPAAFYGHCAPESSERRWCQKKCGGNSDCRSGYECRRTGTHGCEPIPDQTMGDANIPAGEPASFCVRSVS